jgi:hypothetical protein
MFNAQFPNTFAFCTGRLGEAGGVNQSLISVAFPPLGSIRRRCRFSLSIPLALERVPADETRLAHLAFA